ncbi:CpaD family pilus assembly protein [Aliirhizobium smilacinae]|uniref:Pilus assembly protein CpaD n=1 Tax=Aliirhizobium smilacinae TaxID=1395944 RepID=A0A5C4XS72_9HYPH|nr:CpaD family pilus assembly protein [Rhizobium smilacinae]TNM66446.1 pilus assembly protein CpaD [Rhizobium smilacinae]
MDPRKTTRYSTGRLSAALVIGAAALLSSCAGKDSMTTGSLPDDYRTRHPIVVGEAEKTIDIPVAAGDTGLTNGQSEVIAGFVAEYRRSSTGIIQIITPRGSANEGAAVSAASSVRRLMVRMGVPAQKILQGHFPSEFGQSAPIRLSYVAIAARTQPCGQWPEDMTLNTFSNKNYYNFGCANQSNLAAQIANPNDLLGPRRMTPPDGEQRGQVMERYRGAVVELKDMDE